MMQVDNCRTVQSTNYSSVCITCLLFLVNLYKRQCEQEPHPNYNVTMYDSSEIASGCKPNIKLAILYVM